MPPAGSSSSTCAHHARVERFVPGLVAGDHPADPGEVGVALPAGDPPDVAVRDARRTLLERRVDEEVVGIGLALRVEAVGDEVMDRPFHRAHVDAAGESQVRVQQIAMAVLLGGPAAEPSGPRRRAGPFLVADQPVERDRIAGQRFFGDHVADQDDEQIVGHRLRPLCRNRSTCSRQFSASRSGR